MDEEYQRLLTEEIDTTEVGDQLPPQRGCRKVHRALRRLSVRRAEVPDKGPNRGPNRSREPLALSPSADLRPPKHRRVPRRPGGYTPPNAKPKEEQEEEEPGHERAATKPTTSPTTWSHNHRRRRRQEDSRRRC